MGPVAILHRTRTRIVSDGVSGFGGQCVHVNDSRGGAISVFLRCLPVPDRPFPEIVQFWNRPPVRRHVVKEREEFDGDTIELMTAKILPVEEAFAENRAAEEAHKQKEKTRRAHKRAEMAAFRRREATGQLLSPIDLAAKKVTTTTDNTK